MDTHIRIRGARQHNLKDIDVDLPRESVTVVTGPSGSGKSSLALDTLFAEGQRRYVESLSSYAKQFLERMQKPDVDRVDGISPAVAIEQSNPTRTSRSTVGTATEVHDYLRLLFARAGRTHCPTCDRHIQPDSPTSATDRVLELPEGTRFMVAFPLPRSARTNHEVLVENLVTLGFVRLLADGETLDLGVPDAGDPEVLGTDLGEVEELLVVVDRLKVDPGARDRLADSMGTAFREGEGEVRVILPDAGGADDAIPQRLSFTDRFRCPDHPEVELPEPSPQLFSFNSPRGSCPRCTGFGAVLEYDEGLIVPNPEKSLDEGAVDVWEKPRYKKERAKLLAYAERMEVSARAPWEELPEDFRTAVIQGAKAGKGRLTDRKFRGVIPFLKSKEKKRYKQYIRVFLRKYQTPRTCPECGGARVRPEALAVRVGDRTIHQVSSEPLEAVEAWVDGLRLEGQEAEVAESVLRELGARVHFLVEVGLGYLTLNRQTRCLSGGEAQRINLANSLGSRLVDTLYVLDEPSIGLHPRDTGALLGLLDRLRDQGNTVVVVEHDEEAIRRADHVVELGPASGEQGGQVVFQGHPDGLPEADTATGRYLSGRGGVQLAGRRPRPARGWLELLGARLHNVDRVDLRIPLGTLTVVTGVSGSGKSTLVHDVLYRALERALDGGETSAKEHLGEAVGAYDGLEGAEQLEAVVLVDQSPIGRTPRSNPVTYIKAWDEVRRIYAEQPLSRERGYRAGHFSFNVKGGRCEACKGAGHVEVEMVFMADVYVPCDVCRGRRFRPEVLDVKVRGKTIADILELTVDEAIRFFVREDRLGRSLWHLQQVGLGYLRLGQAATTLSGGEAQRLKIARELAGVRGGAGVSASRGGRPAARGRLYLLDEPTTGLSGEDVRRLVEVLDRLVDAGHSVLVIEHNLDVVKCADWIVDMGPEAGLGGGRIVAEGTPEEVAGSPDSITAPFLARALEEAQVREGAQVG
ncbi:MAG: excinuclease ABC subunit A [Gemmatimonadales bacterium]|nr:MAG: excinuclease ABC subunit A [Gemmatimonadales bacterium]